MLGGIAILKRLQHLVGSKRDKDIRVLKVNFTWFVVFWMVRRGNLTNRGFIQWHIVGGMIYIDHFGYSLCLFLLSFSHVNKMSIIWRHWDPGEWRWVKCWDMWIQRNRKGVACWFVHMSWIPFIFVDASESIHNISKLGTIFTVFKGCDLVAIRVSELHVTWSKVLLLWHKWLLLKVFLHNIFLRLTNFSSTKYTN